MKFIFLYNNLIIHGFILLDILEKGVLDTIEKYQ